MSKCGIVDIGSNTIRLAVFQYEADGSFRLLLDQAENAGLAGYIQDGILSDAGISRCAKALSGFRRLLDDLEIRQLYAFATASLRRAANAREAASAIEASTGIPVKLLSGEEEARLSFRGALGICSVPDGTGLLADIGGGSTELVVYENGVIRSADSLNIGSLSLFEGYVSGILPTAAEMAAIDRHIQGAMRELPVLPCLRLQGVGGTVRAVGKLLDVGVGQSFPAGALSPLCRQLTGGNRDALELILKRCADRIHTLLPGMAILEAIARTYGVETITVSAQGIREGYLTEYVLQGVHEAI